MSFSKHSTTALKSLKLESNYVIRHELLKELCLTMALPSFLLPTGKRFSSKSRRKHEFSV